MRPTFEERLAAVPWAEYRTAYGPADVVPDQLRRLSGADLRAAMAASHDLWCGLCHQHAGVASAALPALPFILDVLDRAGDPLTIEILDILFGFVRCTNPGFAHSPPAWHAELRAGVAAVRPRLERLVTHPHPDLSGFAEDILQELDSPRWGVRRSG